MDVVKKRKKNVFSEPQTTSELGFQSQFKIP